MKWPWIYNLVFSSDRTTRWKRHGLFWALIFVYHLVRIGIMIPALNNQKVIISYLEMSLFWGVVMNMLFSYTLVYYLVPKYFKKGKYIRFAFGLVVFVCLFQLIGIFHTLLVYEKPTMSAGIGVPKGAFWSIIRPGFIRLFGNPPLIACLLLSLKILKNWYLAQQKTILLARENAQAEIQLLKAQVHPHFLFNTLNNIYSFSLHDFPMAGSLVKKLSNLLSYMVNECDSPLVPLEREILLLQDYIGLEKVRYGERLVLEVESEGDYSNQLIAPLLLIPFVENSFKHGSSQMRTDAWIHLYVRVEDGELYFNLRNSKPAPVLPNSSKKGIGLANVKKRLKLLYPEQHHLQIEEKEQTFSVTLQLTLAMAPGYDGNEMRSWNNKSVLYGI